MSKNICCTLMYSTEKLKASHMAIVRRMRELWHICTIKSFIVVNEWTTAIILWQTIMQHPYSQVFFFFWHFPSPFQSVSMWHVSSNKMWREMLWVTCQRQVIYVLPFLLLQCSEQERNLGWEKLWFLSHHLQKSYSDFYMSKQPYLRKK
jgi:hypothetical protein